VPAGLTGIFSLVYGCPRRHRCLVSWHNP
jgi:hypothetical protein